MKGRTKKEKSARRLYLKAERLWKEYCFLRDGHECQVKKNRPDIAVPHAGPLQIDHFISRQNKHLFFETSNGTVVCGSCNRYKKFKFKSIDRVIDDIVMEREGEEKYNEMVAIDQTKAPNPHWKRIYWLEDVVKDIEGKLERLKYMVAK